MERPYKPQKIQNLSGKVNFCPKCGTLLEISNKGRPSLSCQKCGFKKLLRQNTALKLNIHYGEPLEIAVIDKDEEKILKNLPTVKALCPTCGKADSETWMYSVGGDAAPSTLTFFRCIRCGTTKGNGMSQKLKIPYDRTIYKPDNSCPKCGKTETAIEINPNTGTPFFVCSNTACHTLRSKCWF